MSQTVLRTPTGVAGPARPNGATPPLRPGTLRRTSTIDVARPSGFEAPRVIDARARDVVGDGLVEGGGGARVLREAALAATIDPDGVLLALEVTPPDASGAELLGAVVGPGFRGRAARHFAADRRDGTPLWTLLDDLPPTMLVSNYARLRSGYQASWVSQGGQPPKSDICAGWQAGGSMIRMAMREGRQPVTFGPAAPPVEVPGEPEAWHAIDPLAPTGSRRRRRLDVVSDAGGLLLVDAMFRDTYATALGEQSGASAEIVVHEYAVRLHIDPVTLEVVDAVADPHVLPFVECPAAAESADRIVGRRLTELRDQVRAEFVGISTCTHLNDLLRSLEDVAGLLAEQRDVT
jgi:Protein of unknown function (DUF2889)